MSNLDDMTEPRVVLITGCSRGIGLAAAIAFARTGDTVIATMATLLAAGLSLREAVPIANRAGSIVVGKFGTASVSYEELFA